MLSANTVQMIKASSSTIAIRARRKIAKNTEQVSQQKQRQKGM